MSNVSGLPSLPERWPAGLAETRSRPASSPADSGQDATDARNALAARMYALGLAAAAATGCPAHDWCVVNHSDPHEGDDYHYSQLAWTGPIQHGVEILSNGTPVAAIGNGSEPEYLDADETAALIDALSAHLARMDTLRAEYAARVTDGGAR